MVHRLTLIRRDDWRAALKEYVRESARREFEYGVFDGPLFAAGAVNVMTGHDVAKGLRGYRSLKTGLTALKKKGFSDASGPFAAVLEEVPAMYARAGDVVVFDGVLGVCMGVCMGADAYAVDPVKGLGRTPLSQAVRAYKVGA